MIEIDSAPGWLVVQDLGRPGHAALGVPEGGAADAWALIAANLAVGNPIDAAGLEWAAGGGRVRFRHGTAIAVAGARVSARLGGRLLEPGVTHAVDPGEVLEIGAFARGRFLYVAVAGGIDGERFLGSRATFVPSRFGGKEGRRLVRGDVLATNVERRLVAGAALELARELALGRSTRCLASGPIAILAGPERDLLAREEWGRLVAGPWRISALSDRAGMRLEGPSLGAAPRPASASMPLLPGAVELTGEGPIVVLVDGPTTGGYPVVGVVPRSELARISQRSPREAIEFVEVDQRAARLAAQQDQDLRARLGSLP